MPAHTHLADTLKTLFRDIFQCRGRDFGSPSRGVLGISDGNEGVQWNAGYYPRDGAVWLGVNLEGMKYDDWPVARLIEREISRPILLTRYRPQVARPDKVTVLWSRDAWQYSARRAIKEANIAPTPVALDRLDSPAPGPHGHDAVAPDRRYGQFSKLAVPPIRFPYAAVSLFRFQPTRLSPANDEA